MLCDLNQVINERSEDENSGNNSIDEEENEDDNNKEENYEDTKNKETNCTSKYENTLGDSFSN